MLGGPRGNYSEAASSLCSHQALTPSFLWTVEVHSGRSDSAAWLHQLHYRKTLGSADCGRFLHHHSCLTRSDRQPESSTVPLLPNFQSHGFHILIIGRDAGHLSLRLSLSPQPLQPQAWGESFRLQMRMGHTPSLHFATTGFSEITMLFHEAVISPKRAGVEAKF